MGIHHPATGLAHLAGSRDATDIAIDRLDLAVIIIAGVLIIGAAWDWLKRR